MQIQNYCAEGIIILFQHNASIQKFIYFHNAFKINFFKSQDSIIVVSCGQSVIIYPENLRDPCNLQGKNAEEETKQIVNSSLLSIKAG